MNASRAAVPDRPESPSALGRTFRALDAAGVHWCVLRGETDVAEDGDVDILVAPEDEAQLGRVLASERFLRLPSWGYGTHSFFLRPDERFERWTKLDVVSELAFGPGFGLRTDAGPACLARRSRDRDRWVLHPDDRFWALLLHRLLDVGAFDDRTVAELRQLHALARRDGPLALAVAAVAPPSWRPSRILDAVERGDIAEVGHDARSAILRAWATRSPVETRWRIVAEHSWRAFARIGIAWRRRGIAVAMLGPDGAGKSTLATGLRDSFPLPVRSIYLAPFPATSGKETGPRGIGFARRMIRLWGGWVAGRGHVLRGRLVVFDRYPLDARIAPRRTLGPAGRLRRWIVGHACPPPELVLVLDVPGATAHARKRELDPDTLESERRAYRRLAATVRSSAVLDATRPPDEVRREAAAIVWRAWIRRWRPR